MKKEWTPTRIAKLAFLIAIVIIIILAVMRVLSFFEPVKRDFTPKDPEDLSNESEDYFVADTTVYPDDYVDDGVTTILVLGDDSFAADRGSTGLAALVAKQTGATVYNCSFLGTTISSPKALDYMTKPIDSFSLYRIMSCIQYESVLLLEDSMTYMETVPEHFEETVALLGSIDFDTIDIVILSYGINDYLTGSITTDVNDPTNTVVNSVSGSLTTSIRVLREKYPHIKIVINSPTFAYYIEEDGTLSGGDTRRTGFQTDENLGGYMVNMKNTAVEENVTFIDNYYGVDIFSHNADKYLADSPIHLNEAGRQLVADHISYVLNNYVIE
ncbi:MAG: SGNH/GDSL hydrolase family protein [Lachnospiraceae bacterium]|nr:SGNH/GDSL hydrolase family protein [Lachnospiraceae bacterium]